MKAIILSAGAIFAAAALLTSCDRSSAGYASPDEAVSALVTAIQSDDKPALLRLLGDDAAPLIESGDPVADANSREEFIARHAERSNLVADGDERAILAIGEDEWPFPFPLVKQGRSWRFDSVGGVDEIVNRRVGSNELATIQSCLAYVDAQREFYRLNPESDPLLHYARKLTSSPGRKDGLYWETADGETESPLGPEFAAARGEGYLGDPTAQPRPPYRGYYYRLLEAQGPDAVGGAYDYVVRDFLIGGFALVAYPAEYGSTGVMTFIVNHDGVVFSKDLGPDTATLAPQITQFNPDDTWRREGE